MKKPKKKMKFSAFIKKYGRVIIGGTIIFMVILMSIFAPYIATHDPQATDPYKKMLLPGVDGHILGTDTLGRDVFSWIVYGGRLALIVTFGVQALAIVFGTIVGLICGYYAKLDQVLMRIMEALNSIPTVVLALVLSAALGRGTFKFILTLSLTGFIGVARLVRGRVLSLRKEEFVECEKVMGASNLRTIVFHILPACSNTLLIRFSSGLAGTMLSMVGLAFLSVGLDTTIPNWGLAVALGKDSILMYPHLVLYPTIAIAITTFAFCMIGDGVRELLGSGRN